MIKYEYNAINNPQFLGDRLLNRLGENGWELVSHAYNSNTCDHFYTFKRVKIEVIPSLSDEEIMEMNQKEYESPGWVDPMMEMLDKEEATAESWMDEHREAYDKLLASGMFWEFYPTLTGEWFKDMHAFSSDRRENIKRNKIYEIKN